MLSISKYINNLRKELSFIQGNLLVLITASVFIFFASGLTSQFRTLYIRELGASPSTIGLMTSIGSAIFTLMRIPGGYIADKYGRKQILVTMTFGVAISYIFWAIAPSWHFIFIGIIIFQISTIKGPAFYAIQADSIPPERRGTGYAASDIIPGIPSIIAPSISGFLVDRFGLIPGMRITYWLVVGCHLITSIIRMHYLKETLENPQKIIWSELFGEFKTSIKSMYDVSRSLSKDVIQFMTLNILSSISGTMFMFTSLYVNDVVGVRGYAWGLLGTVSIFVGLVLGYPLGKVVDRVGRIKSFIISNVIWFPSLILFIFSRNFFTLLIAITSFSITRGLYAFAFNALQADLITREERGRIIAFIGLAGSLVSIPVSTLAGYLYEWNPVAPFLFSLVVDAIAFVFILYLMKEPSKKEI